MIALIAEKPSVAKDIARIIGATGLKTLQWEPFSTCSPIPLASRSSLLAFTISRQRMPTRNGRNAMLFTYNGTMNMRNKKWEMDFSPVDLMEKVPPLNFK